MNQNILIAGYNITITNNTISSTGGITEENLDSKQDKLSAGENITISSSKTRYSNLYKWFSHKFNGS